MSRRSATAALGLVLALAGAAGCAGAGDEPGAAGSEVLAVEPEGDRELLERAGLEPCPASEGSGPTAGGDRLPDLTLPCLGEGPQVALAGLTGAPTLVNLWASWCGPCVEEMPALQALSAGSGPGATDGAGGLRVVGVLTQDRARQGLAAAAGLGVTFPSVVDESGALLRALGLKGLPATVLVRADGTVAHTHVGPALDEATARRLAAEHLGVPDVHRQGDDGQPR